MSHILNAYGDPLPDDVQALPCPRCGSAPAIVWAGACAKIVCGSGEMCPNYHWHATAQDAAAAWNRRAPDLSDLRRALDSALEHASHGWQAFIRDSIVPQQEFWPPEVPASEVGTAHYHFAAMIMYVKRVYDVLPSEEANHDRR